MIHKCSCVHEYQDATYGTGMRVMNPCKPGNPQNFVRCTVCLKEYATKREPVAKPQKKEGKGKK
jgi:hypothetical protein